jgi:hypothetical protein
MGSRPFFFVVKERIGAGKYLIKVGTRLLTARTHLELPLGQKFLAKPGPDGWVVQIPQSPELPQVSLSPFMQALGQEGLPLTDNLLQGFTKSFIQKLQKNRKTAKLTAIFLKQTHPRARLFIEALVQYLEDYEENEEDGAEGNNPYLLALQGNGEEQWQIFPLRWSIGNQKGRILIKFRQHKENAEFAARIQFPTKEYGIHLLGQNKSWNISLFVSQEEQGIAKVNLAYYLNSLENADFKVKLRIEDLEEFSGFGKWTPWTRKKIDEKA